MSVMSFLERRLIRAWRILKRPRKNWPVWVLRPVVAALRTLTRPRLVSSVAPTGIVSAPSSRTKPFGGLRLRGARRAGRELDEHLAGDDRRVDGLERHGRAAPLLSSQPFLMPSLSVSAVPQGSPGGRRRGLRHGHRPGLRGRVADRVGRGGGRGERARAAVGVRDGAAARARAVAEQPRDRGRAGPVVAGGGGERQRCRARGSEKRGEARRGGVEARGEDAALGRVRSRSARRRRRRRRCRPRTTTPSAAPAPAALSSRRAPGSAAGVALRDGSPSASPDPAEPHATIGTPEAVTAA